MRVIKVFNNNVALVTDEAGRECVVQGRGVAFQVRPGDTLYPAAIERRYYPEASSTPNQLAQRLADIPPDLVAVAEKILSLGPTFGLELDPRAAVALADHIMIALRRAAVGQFLDAPLEWEVRILYQREVSLGLHALEVIFAHSGVRLPQSESVPLALHFVNAQVGARDLGQAVRTAPLIRDILAIIETEYGESFKNRNPLSEARFATHLRYLFLSNLGGKRHAPLVAQLAKTFRAEEPRAFDCAIRVAEYLNRMMGWQIGDEETAYLALHIQRMTSV